MIVASSRVFVITLGSRVLDHFVYTSLFERRLHLSAIALFDLRLEHERRVKSTAV